MKLFLIFLFALIIYSSCQNNPVEPVNNGVSQEFPQATDTLRVPIGG